MVAAVKFVLTYLSIVWFKLTVIIVEFKEEEK